jgi:hypothetical protein
MDEVTIKTFENLVSQEYDQSRQIAKTEMGWNEQGLHDMMEKKPEKVREFFGGLIEEEPNLDDEAIVTKILEAALSKENLAQAMYFVYENMGESEPEPQSEQTTTEQPSEQKGKPGRPRKAKEPKPPKEPRAPKTPKEPRQPKAPVDLANPFRVGGVSHRVFDAMKRFRGTHVQFLAFALQNFFVGRDSHSSDNSLYAIRNAVRKHGWDIAFKGEQIQLFPPEGVVMPEKDIDGSQVVMPERASRNPKETPVVVEAVTEVPVAVEETPVEVPAASEVPIATDTQVENQ